MEKDTTLEERILELKNQIYPTLLGYYEDGETYKNAEKYADADWDKIKTTIQEVREEERGRILAGLDFKDNELRKTINVAKIRALINPPQK